MELFEAVYGRRSTRSYTDAPVERTTLLTLLSAAVQAPSALNRQPWLFSIVQDRARLRAYSERAKALYLAEPNHDAARKCFAPLMRSANYDIFHGAGTLIVVSCTVGEPHASADGWLAAGTLMLAAHAMGLGSCCVGLALPLLALAELRAELALGEGVHTIAALVVGHPRERPAPVARAEPKISAWLREG